MSRKSLKMNECYDNIVGITRRDCACDLSGRPDDYDESQSDLYIDELQEFASLRGLEGCDRDVWDLFVTARKNAIAQFVGNTNALLAKKFRIKRSPYTGSIGGIKGREIAVINKNYALVRIVCSPVRSGFMTVERIGAIFDQTGAVTLSVYNNVDGHIEDLDLTTQGGFIKWTDINKRYPLHSKYCTHLEYYFVYQHNGANPARDNILDCGCGNQWTPIFDSQHPYFYQVGKPNVGAMGWSDYIMAGGGLINSLTELDDMPRTMANKFYGLAFDLNFKCNVDEVLCKDSLDFNGNPLASSMAFAIQYKAASNVADGLLRTTLLNRENMINTEAIQQAQLEWNVKYNEHVNYIVDNANITANDCLKCKDVITLTRQGLFS